MTITTTEHIEGKTVAEYLGVVGASCTMALPGNSKMLNRAWQKCVDETLATMKEQAKELGANAVLGVEFRPAGGCLCATGTAVRLA